ncbi:MAG: heavy metal binding protein [Chloroflexi bacterium]|nr:MAG: heavy metal binding protein [Chloroflexota bacterium]MBA4374979.1 heavy metal transporter [Anaerolinea sp.]
MNTIKYSVPGINCNHCVHTIKTELGDLEGVLGVDADSTIKEVSIQYDAPATPEKIENLMAEINYPVKK